VRVQPIEDGRVALARTRGAEEALSERAQKRPQFVGVVAKAPVRMHDDADLGVLPQQVSERRQPREGRKAVRRRIGARVQDTVEIQEQNSHRRV
jgi:hypothetical protein